jgi:hypothetical protein
VESGVTHEVRLRDRIAIALRNYVGHPMSGEVTSLPETADLLVSPHGGITFALRCARWEGQRSLLRSIDDLLGCLSGHKTGAALVILARSTELPHVAQAIAGAIRQHKRFAGIGTHFSRPRFDYRLHPDRGVTSDVTIFSVLLCSLPD